MRMCEQHTEHCGGVYEFVKNCVTFLFIFLCFVAKLIELIALQ